jgi:hypothetical protein
MCRIVPANCGLFHVRRRRGRDRDTFPAWTYFCHLTNTSTSTSIYVHYLGRTRRDGPDERRLPPGRLGSALARRQRTRRAKRLKDERSARVFDAKLQTPDAAIHEAELPQANGVARPDRDAPRASKTEYGARNGVYSYQTAPGKRWRFVAARSDGRPTSKRGFT